MGLKTKPFDEANYLHSDSDRKRYLKACMDEGADDPALVTHAIGVVARSRNMSELARKTGLTREGLYKALSEDGNPSFATIWKVFWALGVRCTLIEEQEQPVRMAAKRVPRAATKAAATKTISKKPAAKKTAKKTKR